MELNESAFKLCYKYLKSKSPLPDFSKVIDFAKKPFENTRSFVQCEQKLNTSIDSARLEEVGMNPPDTWNIFASTQQEGVYLIQNPFSSAGQRMWIRRCIEKYPCRPNFTNIDNLITSESWLQQPKSEKKKDYSLLPKLRWVTIGVHHNWKTKVYDFNTVTEFPEDLSILSKCVAEVMGFKDYKPEAAIVNYYSLKSSFGGHNDHSELDHSSPLLSFSFGQTAIFLLGGLTLDVEPVPLFLQSGDILILTGKSRLVYHGVPCILEAKTKPWGAERSTDGEVNEDWKTFENYIRKSRINMSVRQVFPADSHP